LSGPGYSFFFDSRPDHAPVPILTVYGLNDAPSPKDVRFWGFDDVPQLEGVQTPKKPKGGVVRHFPGKVANSQNNNISDDDDRIDTKF